MFPNDRPFSPLTGSPYVSLVDVFISDNLTAFIAKSSRSSFAFVFVHNNLRRFSLLATHYHIIVFFFWSFSTTMYPYRPFLALLLSAGAAHSAVVPASGANLEERVTSCTFTDAASAMRAKTSCPTITLDSLAVPASKTLDLTGLTKGTHARLL